MRRTIFRSAITVGLALAMVGFGGGASSGADDRGLARAMAVQDRHTPALLSDADVVGTATGIDARGRPTILVLTARAGVPGIPDALEGISVSVRVVGELRALHHRDGHTRGPGGGNGDDPSEPDPDPDPGDLVPIGVSTGNEGECSAGTIGARVSGGGKTYALSNNHVYALENRAQLGSRVLHPGRYDTNCSISNDNVLGKLSAYKAIVFDGQTPNRIDAAIAVNDGPKALGTSTPSDGYGTPTSSTVAGAVGLNVQKYGRTTGLTTGQITGINATVRVGFGSGTALFVGQLIVETGGKPFIKSGDSGSLLVTDPGRQPVGLLFAGNINGKLAIANEIRDVLAEFGVSIDGS